MIAYKLMCQRKDGTLGPLFINRKQRIPIGEWLEAEDHPTKGYAYRPGWHVLPKPSAPHLADRGRVWVEVEIKDYESMQRPVRQGGEWYLAKRMQVLALLPC
jgi:hypothetical protein